MSGFLESLAARSSGRERVLEPRRLLYEPREEPPLDPGSDLEPGAAPLPPAQPPPAPREPAGLRPTTAATDPPRDDDGRPDVAPAEPVPRRRRSRAAELVHVGEDVAPSPNARPESRKPQPTAHAEPPAPLRDALASLVARPRRVRAEVADRAPATRPHVLRPPRATAPRAPTGPDVVRITIGRVDVRAVHAPEENAPARAAPPPRMTLDEYLARGRRR